MSKRNSTWESSNRPEVVQPTETDDGRGRTEYNHPAFGAITACRVQGGHQPLHGSDFIHNGYVEIRISHSRLIRDLSQDWHHPGDEIVSVKLSEAQWATFVSTLNTACGTPCTIDHIQGVPVPRIPHRNEKEAVHKDFEKTAKELADRLKELKAVVEQETAGLSKVKRDKIMSALWMADKQVSDCMPFIAKSFNEAVENIVETAKVEVEAYMHGRIMQAGLSLLSNEQPILLENKKE